MSPPPPGKLNIQLDRGQLERLGKIMGEMGQVLHQVGEHIGATWNQARDMSTSEVYERLKTGGTDEAKIEAILEGLGKRPKTSNRRLVEEELLDSP